MNWQHLYTLLWLRWRLTVNHVRRYGVLNVVLLSIGAIGSLIGSVMGFFTALTAGMYFLPKASPAIVMYICDVWVLAFLFFWAVGVMTDLQRGEMLSLDKLLHLPTTLAEVFLFNFLSSLMSLTTLTFVPPMLGLCIAITLTRGAAGLVMFPLVAGFVLMVCAVTYQFRGWLATLMTNKRNQRTVMVVVTIVFVLGMQAPQLINLAFQRQMWKAQTGSQVTREELTRKLNAREITPQEFVKAQQQLTKRSSMQNQRTIEQFNRGLEMVNLALPIGWLAGGAQAAAAGNPWPGLAGTLGMAAIAALSLRRSYRTTLRFFTADQGSKVPRAAVAPAPATATKPAPGNLIEWSLPFATEPVAAVAWTTFRSLLRAPEVKLVLLGPVIMLVVFGAVLLPNLGSRALSGVGRSLMPLGVLGLSIVGLTQISQNTFGFDRSGFRAFVLSGVARHQILIGKNLAFAPLVFLPAIFVLTLLQILAPMPATHFAAALTQIPTVYLLMCLMGNVCSILCPVCQAAGSLKPANPNQVKMLVQFFFLMITVGVLSTATVLPVGLEWILQTWANLPASIPLALILAVIELAVCGLLYAFLIRPQGTLLQYREFLILETVIERGE